MTKEEKQLFLIDLSARFPYNVAVDCRSENSRFTCYLTSDMLREIQNNTCYWEYKTYLFPLSSMTEEQKEELDKAIIEDSKEAIAAIRNNDKMFHAPWRAIDWLNANHFDYRGLIEKGLAIDATNLNIY